MIWKQPCQAFRLRGSVGPSSADVRDWNLQTADLQHLGPIDPDSFTFGLSSIIAASHVTNSMFAYY